MRVLGTFLGFVGMLGVSALAAVTALHVDLEHGHTHGLEAPEHGHRHPAAAAKHEHGVGAPNHGSAHQAEAPDHDHALALVASVADQSRRSRTTLRSVGHVLATVPLGLDAPSRVPARISRAGPAARAAPLSRRSVVLQV